MNISVGTLLKLKCGRIDKVVKIIPETSWDYQSYETLEVRNDDVRPKRAKVYCRENDYGVYDALPL